MVDPVELILVEQRPELAVELLRGLQVVTEGLLHDHPRVLRQSGRGETFHDRTEQGRRDLQVEDRRRCVADGFRDRRERHRVFEVAADIGHAGAEPVEDVGVGLGLSERRRDRLRRAPAQIVVGPALGCDAHDRAGQQLASLELVQRYERHLVRKVAGDSERNENVSRLWALCAARHEPSEIRCRVGRVSLVAPAQQLEGDHLPRPIRPISLFACYRTITLGTCRRTGPGKPGRRRCWGA